MENINTTNNTTPENEKTIVSSEQEQQNTRPRMYGYLKAEDYFVRETFFTSYEIKEAIRRICYNNKSGKSELIRILLSEGLENIYPGILHEVKEEAEKNRRKAFEKKYKIQNEENE